SVEASPPASTMTSSETPPPSVATTTATPPPSSTSAEPHAFSKLTFRTLERNSNMIFALATSSKGSLISRVSLAANELLREIAEKKVEEKTLKTLEFYVIKDQLKMDGAEPLIFLAQSILAMARSIGGFEDTVVQPPAFSLKPPMYFGDGEDGDDNVFARPSGSRAKTQEFPLFRNDEPAADGEILDTSDNTETSAASTEKDKPVTAVNDWCVKMRPTYKFRPLTPEGDKKDERTPTPSPPPSPTLRALLNMKRKRTEGDEEETDQEENEDDEETQQNTTASSSVDKEGLQCPMCDTFFYAQHQLESHLVGYHRMKPTFGDTTSNSSDFQPSVSSAHNSVVGGSASILSTRPLNGFGQQRKEGGGGTAHMKATELIRTSATTVTSPGGTVRHYSSPSNAARAAAKAAAAAANGVFRPNAPSKPYTCRQCGVVLTSQQMYASHVRYNHPKEKMGENGTPTTKPKSTSDRNRETAIVHLVLDDGSKAFKCRRCDKVFDSAQKVAGHSRHCLLVFEGKARPANQGPVPTEDRPYTVYRCGLNSDLARTCPYCGELLPSIRKVDKHVRMVHEQARHEVYGCSTCDRRFVTLGGIENHWLHYGDCPHGVLTVHKDGMVTCADIGEIPPPLKRPKMMLEAEAAAAARLRDSDEDPSVAIVNSILGAHGFMRKNREAPELSPEADMEDSERMEMGLEDEEETETAPDLEEYGEEEDELLMNGSSHLDEDEDDEGRLIIKEEEEEEEVTDKKGKVMISMKLISCKHCKFIAKNRATMDEHVVENHPEHALMDDEDDGLPTTSESPDEEHNQAMNGSASRRNGKTAAATPRTRQTGEMRRMLGIAD
ncbi:hypothetical protein PMAYCL1PPCAC_13626, partial [Pristionchus mayeri]